MEHREWRMAESLEAKREKAKAESDQRNPQSSILVLEISAVCRDPSVPSRVFAATAPGYDKSRAANLIVNKI
jgi:hypothetical protein